MTDEKCTGPFSDAFDCPVHDPRKRVTPAAVPAATQPSDDALKELWYATSHDDEWTHILGFARAAIQATEAAAAQPPLDDSSLIGRVKLLVARFRSLGGIPELCDLAWKLCNEVEAGHVLVRQLMAEVERLRSLHAAPEGARQELPPQQTAIAQPLHVALHEFLLAHQRVGDDMMVGPEAWAKFHRRVLNVKPAWPDAAPVVTEGALRALVEQWRELAGQRPLDDVATFPAGHDMTETRYLLHQHADELTALLPARPASVKET